MKKIRLADVARIAGVSNSTVDRVLNERPGVKPETVARVEAAMLRLGYSVNSLSRKLSDNPLRMALLLPADGTAPTQVLREALVEEAERRREAGLDIHMIEIAPYDSAALVRALKAIGEGIDTVISPLIETAAVTRAVNAIVNRGVRVLTIYSDAPESSRQVFIGCDGYSAGRTAGALMARFLAPGAARAWVLVGDPAYRDHLDRRSGFEQAMATLRPEVSVATEGACRNSPENARRLVERVLDTREAEDGLYIIGEGHAGVLEALRAAGSPSLPIIAHELTPDTRVALETGLYAALVVQDPRRLAQIAFEAAIGRSDARVPVQTVGILLHENLPQG